MPRRRGSRPARTGSAPGTMTAASTNAVHTSAGTDGDRPGHEQGHQRERGGQRPAQVVEHLPARERGIGLRLRWPAASRARPRIHGSSCQSPRAQRCWRGRSLEVVGRELVEQLDVGDQARAGEGALEQVVAEHRGSRARGRPSAALEGVDVVDALAGEAALAEQVLVDVGDRRRVRIDPGRAGEDPLRRASGRARRAASG